MGEHTPISRPSEASSSTKKVRRRKVDREALPLPVHSESMDVDEDVLDGPSTSYEASSSKLVPTPAKEVSLSKRSKGKGKLEDAVALTSAPAPVEGKRKKDKGKETARETESGLRNTVPNPASWPCVPLAQGGISRVPHVWSKDGRFFFTVSGTSIHIHSSTSPFTRLSTLTSHPSDPTQGHTKPINSLLLSPTNPLQLITSSGDGTVKVWDWVDGRLARTIFSHTPATAIDSMCVGEVGGRFWVFVAATYAKESDGKKKAKADGSHLTHRIFRVPLSAGARGYLTIGKLSAPASALFCSPSSTYLVALSANKAYAFRLPVGATSSHDWKITSVKFVSDQPLTCGAFAPADTLSNREEWFATGDQRGVIRLWHGLGAAFRQLDAAAGRGAGVDPTEERRLPTTSLHWHAHAVAAIAFNPSGSQLLSVGEESVLVQWHLASGKREYIPRLGGRPIITLGVKAGARGVEEEWWMTLADGGVVRVGAASGQVNNVGQGIRLDPLRPTSNKPYPLAVHPSTSSLVVSSSHASTLQFIDPQVPSVLFDLEVAPSNRVARKEEREIEPVAVEKVAFSSKKHNQIEWMATMESRVGDLGEGGGAVRNLKIWKWLGERYLVNTQLPRPHGLAEMTAMTFSPVPTTSIPITAASPKYPYLLTASNDGSAKIWQVRQARKSEHGKSKKSSSYEVFWSLRTAFDYRGMPIYDASFSPDGTLVALAHGSVVSLWDTESNALLRTLDGGAISDVRKLAFVGAEGRYLVGSGSKGFVVWDLLSCEVAWSNTSQAYTRVIAHPSAPIFITVHHTPSPRTVLTSWSPTSPKATPGHRIPHTLRDLVLLPPSTCSSVDPAKSLNFIGITTSGEILRFGDGVSKLDIGARGIKVESVKTNSIWQEMFGKDAFVDLADALPQSSDSQDQDGASAVQARAHAAGRPTAVFDGPSHTLPPIGMLFDAFIEEILGAPTQAPQELQATASGETILFESAIHAEDEVTEQKVKSKVVTDEEVKELESLFRDVLANKPARQPVTPAKPNGLPNGNGNGHGHSAAATPSSSVAVGNISSSGKSKKEKKRKEKRESLGVVAPTQTLANGNGSHGLDHHSEDEADAEGDVSMAISAMHDGDGDDNAQDLGDLGDLGEGEEDGMIVATPQKGRAKQVQSARGKKRKAPKEA